LGQVDGRTYLGVQVVDPPGVAAAHEVPAPPLQVEPLITEEVVTATVTAQGGQVVTGEASVGGDIVIMAPGLIVAEVVAGGPAAMAGLVAGDLIIAVDKQPVATPEDMINALKGHTPGEVALLTVQKGGSVGAVIADIPVTLGAAPDEPSRAYLGIRFVAAPSAVTTEMLPPGEGFTAPAMPVLPGMAMPTLPETIMGYSYPGAYPGAYGGSCGTQIFQYFYPPLQQGAEISAVPFADLPYSVAPFTAPLPPMISARPVAPMAPFFIYHSAVNPEVYPQGYTYGATEEAGNHVIFLHAAPVVAPYSGVPMDAMGQKDMVVIQAYAQPTWTMALPRAAGAFAEAAKSISVQVLPQGATMESVPAPAAPSGSTVDIAVPQPVQPTVPAPTTVDDWF
jgi:hypothetical protein